MKQRGRKSAGELAVASPVLVQPRPDAPVELTPEQADVWNEVVDALPADWFPAETHPLLIQYCRIRSGCVSAGNQTHPLLIQYCRHTIEARRIAQLIDQECAREELDVATYAALLRMQARETTALKSMASSMRLSQQSSRRDDNSATAKKNRTVTRPWEG